MERISKLDLISTVATATNSSQALVKEILESTLSTIVNTLTTGQSVHLGNNFGSFKPRRIRAAKKTVPGIPTPVSLPAKTVIKFLPAAALKSALNS